jgi:hypothetical protein
MGMILISLGVDGRRQRPFDILTLGKGFNASKKTSTKPKQSTYEKRLAIHLLNPDRFDGQITLCKHRKYFVSNAKPNANINKYKEIYNC